MSEQASPLIRVRKCDSAWAAAVDARDVVEPCQTLVYESVVCAQQLRNGPILAQIVGDEHLRLLSVRVEEAVVEVRILKRIGELLGEEAKVEPLGRKTFDECVDGARIRQHPPNLLLIHGGFGQTPVFGQLEQGLVGDAAPQEERQPRGDRYVVEVIDVARLDPGGRTIDAEQKLRVDYESFQRELDPGVEAATFRATLPEEPEQHLHVLFCGGTAKGASGHSREDLRGAHLFFRAGLGPAYENLLSARCLPVGAGDLVRASDLNGVYARVVHVDLIVGQDPPALLRLRQ